MGLREALAKIVGGGSDSWRDRLQTASFRGETFWVDDSSMAGGHKLNVHEYPYRDTGYAENFGASVERFSVTAFLAGDGYMSDRDRLIKALRQSVPGEYVDPYMGSVIVEVESWEKVETRRDGGIAVFRIAFVTAGEPAELVITDSISSATVLDQVEAALTAASTAVQNVAEAVAAFPAAANAAINQLRSAVILAAARVRSGFTRVARELDELGDNLAGSDSVGAKLCAAIQSAVDGITDLGDMLRLAMGMDDTAVDPEITGVTPELRAVEEHQHAADLFMRRTFLATAAARAAEATFTTWDEVIEARDSLCSRLRDVALYDLADQVYSYLTRVAADMPRLTTVEIQAFSSAIELAWRLYGDVGRAEEIASENGLEHPGFVTKSVEVLSS